MDRQQQISHYSLNNFFVVNQDHFFKLVIVSSRHSHPYNVIPLHRSWPPSGSSWSCSHEPFPSYRLFLIALRILHCFFPFSLIIHYFSPTFLYPTEVKFRFRPGFRSPTPLFFDPLRYLARAKVNSYIKVACVYNVNI